MTTGPLENTTSPVAVLLVDDHAVVREGCRRALTRSGRITILGEAGTGEEGCSLFEALRPGVVVLDLSLPGIGGVEACQRMLAIDADARIVAFSIHDDELYPRRALDAGARGYVTKAMPSDVLVEAVLAVAAGRTYVSHDVAAKLEAQTASANCNPVDALSPREFDVFRMLVEGKSLPQVAEALLLSPKTVANYQSSVRLKLNVANTAQAVRLAMTYGMLPSDPTRGDPGPAWYASETRKTSGVLSGS